MADGIGLQAIQLIQHTVHGRIGNEMKHIAAVIVAVLRRGRLIDERRRARKGVMRGADGLAVGEGLAAQIGREAGGEVLEGAQLGADVDGVRGSRCGGAGGVVVVEDDGENGLRAAGVLDGLVGEERRVGGRGGRGGLVFAVWGRFGGGVW